MPRVLAFVSRHNLHRSGVPVRLGRCIGPYQVYTAPLNPRIYGLGYFGQGVKIVIANNRHDPYTVRMTIAHEIGHDLLRHSNTLHLCRSDGWWYRHNEVQANNAAARLLIPEDVLMAHLLTGASLWDMSHAFQVPVELLRFKVDKGRVIQRLLGLPTLYRQGQVTVGEMADMMTPRRTASSSS